MKKILFDQDWRYFSGPYMSFAPFPPQIEESRWTAIDLPHDAINGLPRNAQNPSGMAGGYTQSAMLYYKKEFIVCEDWNGKQVLAEFEGVFSNAEIILNGNQIAFHPYGYTSFLVDLTPYLRIGKKNSLVVTVNDLAKPNCRWYSGAGIYRHVWLHVGEKVAVQPWNMKVTTPEVSAGQATVKAMAVITNRGEFAVKGRLRYTILHKGESSASGETALTNFVCGETKLDYELTISDPVLWDVDSPNLYTLCYEVVLEDGTVADCGEVEFGIRTIEVDSVNGFRLNGRSMKMKGGCVHHDHGPLGAASFDEAEERRVRLLKEAGYDSVRCSHNPPSPAFLRACDKLGMLVIDEALDGWQVSKTAHDYHLYFREWWRTDMRSMIDRDFNHPSIVMWSIGNEVAERDGSSNGAALCQEMVDFVKALDDTRFITEASNSIFIPKEDEDGAENVNWAANLTGNTIDAEHDYVGDKTAPFFAPLDVVGYNYLIKRYAFDRKKFPDRVIVGSETFPHTLYENWTETVKNPNVIGDFVWTSFDYLGESGIGKVEYDQQNGWGGAYPWFYANCGDLDICGVKRPQSYYRDILWGLRTKPYIGVYDPKMNDHKLVFKEWAWEPVVNGYEFPGCEGMETKVDVYSPHDEVELFVNGKSCGKQPAGDAAQYKATFTITYEPGELKAVAYQDGKAVEEEILRTAGEAKTIRLLPETAYPIEGQRHLHYVQVEIADADGRLVSYADNLVHFSCTGAGKLIAVGNANPITEESFTADFRKAYQGRVLAILERTGEGDIVLTARADGLETTSIVIG